MASGSYAQMRPSAMSSSGWGKRKGKLWVLYVTGKVVCFVTIFMGAGTLSQHSTASDLTARGGQTYAIQVGGDQAGTWQQDHPVAVSTLTAQLTLQERTPYTVVRTPSLSVAFINQVLATYKSPAKGRGKALYNFGKKSGIDPAIALAFFMHESSFGTQGEATKSLSLGNIRCIPNYRCADNFAQFDTWEDGFKAWYRLIRNLYVVRWELTTVDQIVPRYAPAADHNDVAAYIGALKRALDTWHAGQITIR